MITTTTASFQVFDEISIMTQGGPVGSTNMLSYYIYESGFIYYDIGQASAASMFLLAIVMIATYANFRLLSKKFTINKEEIDIIRLIKKEEKMDIIQPIKKTKLI